MVRESFGIYLGIMDNNWRVGVSLDHACRFILIDGLRLTVIEHLLHVMEHLLSFMLGIALAKTLANCGQCLHCIVSYLAAEFWVESRCLREGL